MLFFRLKTECADNLKLVLLLWGALGFFVWSFFDWWSAPLASNRNQGMMGFFAISTAAIIVFFLVFRIFKRGDLKEPQEFYNLRQTQASILFGAKLAFAWMVVILPMGVMMTLLGFMAGIGVRAIWQGMETMIWAGFFTGLLALSCMTSTGIWRSLLHMLAFFSGVLAAAFVLSLGPVDHLLGPLRVHEGQEAWNLLVVLVLLNGWLLWRCICLAKDRHRATPPLMMACAGICAFLMVAFVSFPGKVAGFVFDNSATTLPTVKKAEIDYFNVPFGYGDRGRYVSIRISLILDKAIPGKNMQITKADLTLVGAEKPWVRLDATRWMQMGSSEVARINFDYEIFSGDPGSENHDSLYYHPDTAEAVKMLPRRLVRLLGTVNMTPPKYREVARGSIMKPWAHNSDGLMLEYVPNHSPTSAPSTPQWKSFTAWKKYCPPLLTGNAFRPSADASNAQDLVRFRLENSMWPVFDAYSDFAGSRIRNLDFFGTYRASELKFDDIKPESTKHWRDVHFGRRIKSSQEWMQGFELVCEVQESPPLILPVDIEFELPDPDKLLELLLKGNK
jgi:hypothetical protein